MAADEGSRQIWPKAKFGGNSGHFFIKMTGGRPWRARSLTVNGGTLDAIAAIFGRHFGPIYGANRARPRQRSVPGGGLRRRPGPRFQTGPVEILPL